MNNHIQGFVEDIIGPLCLARLKLLYNKNNKNAFYDVMTFKIFKKYLRDDSICIDVGCHTGSVLRAMMKYAPNGKFYAFEPLPHLYQYLYNNFGANTSVKLFPIALSNKKGTSRFNYVISNPGYSGFLKRRYDRPSEKDTEIMVATDSLDSLIEANDRISLIKIDVEGAEFLVLQGAINTIKRNRPIIIFEHGIGGADIYQTGPDDIYNLLYEECGMNISTLDEWLLNKMPLSKHEFREQFNRGLNYYFIAYASQV